TDHHSFPTRRASDLDAIGVREVLAFDGEAFGDKGTREADIARVGDDIGQALGGVNVYGVLRLGGSSSRAVKSLPVKRVWGLDHCIDDLADSHRLKRGTHR